ncbi:UNVERIFIED_CONTAM: hypothetical protein RMT77_008038 [Armadillidium vulgare]
MSSQFHVPKSFDNKMTQLNLKDDNSDNLTADSENATVSSDEDMLNDFLTLKAKMLISSLQNKKQTLEDDLKIYKCDIGNMREKLNNAEKFEKKINKELDASKRDVNKKEQLLKKKSSELESHQKELSKKDKLCQELHKEIHSLKKDLREEKRKSSILNSQNKGLKIQIDKLSKTIEQERQNFQERRDQFQQNGKAHDDANRQLKKRVSDLVHCVKEQEKLIEVLRQQKAVILGANVSKTMEVEFKEMIQNLSEQRSEK